MLKLSRVMAAILNFRSTNDSQFSTGPPNDHSCKVTIQLAWWLLTRRFLKFQRTRTHYAPWQPCWIVNQHQRHKYGRGPSNEHFWQVWFKSVQWFQRRRFKCEKLTDGRRTPSHDKSSHDLWPGELRKSVPWSHDTGVPINHLTRWSKVPVLFTY
jgi:hypothetical protein